MNVNIRPALAASPFPGIHHATLAGCAQGLSALSIWEQILAPGAATPPHRHDCEEVVLCSAGHGQLRYGVDRIVPFGPNMTVCIPRDEPHQLVNTGNEPLHIVAVFSKSPVEVYFPDGEPIALPWAT